jgi:PAS domain S-box-containing protein
LTGIGAWSWFPATGIYQWAGLMEMLLEIPAGQGDMYQQWRGAVHADDLEQATTNHLTWNDIAYQLLGVDPNPVPLTYTHWLSAVHPDDRAAAQQEMEQAIAAHQTFSLQYRVLHPDGTQRWIADRGQGIYAADGQVVRTAGVMYDITQRKTAELALQTSETRFRQIAETVRDRCSVSCGSHPMTTLRLKCLSRIACLT